jgi:DNA helicase-2/ATP-dependent DNA helicase PcrA
MISPNKLFGDYISTVLPELGEEPIYELRFLDIAEIQLEGVIHFEYDKDPLENEDLKWAERVRFKSTLIFLKQIDRFIDQSIDLIFKPMDYTFGRFTVTADWIQARLIAYRGYPIKKRLSLISDDIYERFDSENIMDDEIPRARVILKSLILMLKVKNSLSLYKLFYQWLECPDLLYFPNKNTLEWSDVYPFLYVHRAFEGLKDSKLIKHLVIDEMQDYTPIQYAVINYLFSCEKTILGDFGQFVNLNHLHTLADLCQLYSDANLVELNKSYRSTYEIITFAMSIQDVCKLEPIERHGNIPIVISCTDWKDELLNIKKKLNTFLTSEHESLGIIMKTNSAARKLYDSLADDYDIQLISLDSTHFLGGITVTSIQMSKGLEFDEVIIPNVSDDTYQIENDRSLLYIAITRAMHQLTLFYSGNPSDFLPK